MSKLKLKFNEDHIKLIKHLIPRKINDSLIGINNYELYSGDSLYDDMSYILDKRDNIISTSDIYPYGPQFDDETLKYFNELDGFIVDHLLDIIEILIQFTDEGIKPNITYWCYDYQRIWKKEES